MAETPDKPKGTRPNRKPPLTPRTKPRADWDIETKARAVGLMIAGSPYIEVTKTTGVPKTTLQHWFAEIGPEQYTKAREGQKSLVDLIEELARENFTTLIEQSKLARNAEWFNRQNAADIAVLQGVMTDKTVRVVQQLQQLEQRKAALAVTVVGE